MANALIQLLVPVVLVNILRKLQMSVVRQLESVNKLQLLEHKCIAKPIIIIQIYILMTPLPMLLICAQNVLLANSY